MKTKQSMSLRFAPWSKKRNDNGEVPIYAVITTPGDEKSFSLGEKIPSVDWWDEDQKIVSGNDELAFRVNVKISSARSAINDHFLVLCALHEDVTATMIKAAYLNRKYSIVSQRAHRSENSGISHEVDTLIKKYLKFLKREKKELENRSLQFKKERLKKLAEEKDVIHTSIKNLEKRANIFFDDLSVPKTLMDSIDEWMINMLVKTKAELISPKTLSRWPVTKNKLTSFLQSRHNIGDIKLLQVQFKFAEQFYDYLTIKGNSGHNSAMKHVKNIKQVIDRAVSNSWISVNPIKNFKCSYIDPNQEGIVMTDIQSLINKEFDKKSINIVKDIFLFCCFTGYAYQDVRALTPEHIITGIDGKKWIAINRAKTGSKEDVPLLPIAQQLIEKYKNHKICKQKNRLLPVMDNRTHNLYLKEIAEQCGIKRDLTTHIARHTFATTVTLENDVPLPTVQKMLGHKSIRTTEKYAKASRLKVSRNMTALSDKLFTEDGSLISSEEYYGDKNLKRSDVNQPGLRVAFKK